MVPGAELEQRRRTSETAVRVGLAVNSLLAAAKLAAGIAGQSSALVSDGVNSISDVVYYLIVAVLVRHAAKPPDREHPYGHTQLESIASLVVGAFILTTAVAIFWQEVNTLLEMARARTSLREVAPIALWVALATVAIKALLSWWTRRRGRLEANAAVEALAEDHASDLAASAAVAVGIMLARSGYPWLDPLAGAIVATLIFRTGLLVLRDSARELMDAVPSETVAASVRRHLEDIRGLLVEEIHSHRFGPYLVLNLTIGLDGSLSIAQGDHICDQVEARIYDRMPEVRKVYVHYHPARAGTSVQTPPRGRSGAQSSRDQ